ncbi:MAG: F0F1 ATP synthase subunit B [Candidatus Gracilibacteria bacterium]
MELIAKLGIDAKILIAQIVNFVILLLVLGKFVYGPVVEKLEQRRGMIAKSVHDAKKSEELLREIEQTRLDMIAQTKKVTLEMIEQAAKTAEETKNSIVESARQATQEIHEQSKLQLAREKEKMLKEASEELGRLVVSAAEKIIEREFSPEDQKRLIANATAQFTK